MAVPKKKVSRSRRNMRRFASGNRMDPVTVITSAETGEVTRPHRVTLATIDSYVESRAKAKGSAKPKSKKSK